MLEIKIEFGSVLYTKSYFHNVLWTNFHSVIVHGDRASRVLAVITCYHDLDRAAAVPAVDLVRGSIGTARGAGEVKAVNTLAQFPRRAPPWGPPACAGLRELSGSGPTPPRGGENSWTATSRRAQIDQRQQCPQFNVPTV